MKITDIESIARQLVADGRGILAADESTPTITKRLKTVDVDSTAESRRDYREMLLGTEGIGEFISGVILYDETIRQDASDGRSMVDLIKAQGILPGIKVDTGAKDLAGAPGEKVTEGLDGLRDRLAEYYALGARFTKWRAVITIGGEIPTPLCIHANAHALARYAALAQEAGMVPIVEPEVLLDGDHSIDRCFVETERTLNALFDQLAEHRVLLEGLLLKASMVLSGKDAPNRAGHEEVADATVKCLRRTVPAAVPGVVFLSGGQTDFDASAHLNAIAARGPHPWAVSFSYARALQGAPMGVWRGDAANVSAARQAFHHRARMNSLARQARWSPDLEKEPVAA